MELKSSDYYIGTGGYRDLSETESARPGGSRIVTFADRIICHALHLISTYSRQLTRVFLRSSRAQIRTLTEIPV